MNSLECYSVGSLSSIEDYENVLGVVYYGSEFESPRNSLGAPLLSLNMAKPGSGELIEVWAGGKTVSGREGNLHYAHDGEYLFCTAEIPGSEMFGEVTRDTYMAAFELIETLGYPQIFRMWNFIPDINNPNADGLEIYRDFCSGRAEAFERYTSNKKLSMPAATGIGCRGGNLSFYFLACRTGLCLHLENPRQMPAYTYPRQYGPRSPSFARATSLVKPTDGVAQVYVSGTASIVGHETVHIGDIEKQCEVSLENIAILLSKENLASQGLEGDVSLSELDFIKVYVRREEDIPVVRRICERHFSRHARIEYFNVDICRSSLLVEIEAISPPVLRRVSDAAPSVRQSQPQVSAVAECSES